MYNNPYANSYPSFGQQNLNDRIDNQIAQLNQMKEQIKNNTQQPAINQTFQLAPNNHAMRYANTIDEVAKETIYADTPFFSKDMSVLWIKHINGDIKTYELCEIIPKDAKDLQIEYLQAQIEELKGMMKNDGYVANADKKQNAEDTSTNGESVGTTTKEVKSSNVSKVSRSKKE